MKKHACKAGKVFLIKRGGTDFLIWGDCQFWGRGGQGADGVGSPPIPNYCDACMIPLMLQTVAMGIIPP